MLVRDLMSSPVITIQESANIGDALETMRNKKIRHLPVVNMENALVGIVSEGDLLKVFPKSKELSTFEANLLSRTPVSKVMQKNPVSTHPSELLEEAALIMRTNHISCLPVLGDEDKMSGMITKNDIIDSFVAALGLEHGGTRITIKFQKRWGFLSELVAFADKRNVYIDNIVTFEQELVIKIRGTAQEFVDDLRKAGYIVKDVSYIHPPKQAIAE